MESPAVQSVFEILHKLINTEHCIKKQKDDSLIPGETSFF